jgi:hypothetical protein
MLDKNSEPGTCYPQMVKRNLLLRGMKYIPAPGNCQFGGESIYLPLLFKK